MARVVVTVKVMPDSPDADLAAVAAEVSDLVKKFSGSEPRVSEQPIAFGLKALIVQFVMDEAKGDTEPLERQIKAVPAVQSVEVTDVRRAVG